MIRSHTSSLTRIVCLLLIAGSISWLTPRASGQAVNARTTTQQSIVLRALEDELTRAMETLTQKGEPPPYFIGYQVTESSSAVVSAARGALRTSDTNRARLLDTEVRVGDYKLDNTRQLRGQRDAALSRFAPSVQLPLEDDIDAIKSRIYLDTDRKYRAAVERLIQVKTNLAVRVQAEDESADFSSETPQKTTLPLATLSVDLPAWERRVRDLSAIFKKYPEIFQGDVSFTTDAQTKFIVNSEGASVQHSRTQVRLAILARTKAEDGMELFRFESFDAHTPERMPDEAAVRRAIEKMATDLVALRKAPVIEPYAGPAILSGRASGVFFHEIFGHRIEGHRQKDEQDGQTFTKQVNQPVLPTFISVYDDPTTARLAGTDLNGYYQFDDEGVKSERVAVIENGVLKNFLMSRAPVKGFARSNGHGRKSPGFRAVGRQGNLIVETTKTVSERRLREMLIEEARKQSKPYGLLFQDISGGFTFTGRATPQSFQVTPIMVYRVYTDGRPDELVRGAALIGTPLTSFSRIIASSDTAEVFNGVCGAESGWVPVSAVSPSILTTQIEVQKQAKSSDRLPILPPPNLSRK